MTPPGYPLLLSLLLRAGGEAHFAKLATLFAVLFQALSVALLPLASRLFWRHSLPGTIAGFVSLVPPMTWIIPAWDANVTAACLLGYCALTAIASPGSKAMPARVALPLTGAAALLMNPAALLVIGPLSCFAIVRIAQSNASRIRHFAVLWLVTGLLVLPWAWRNYVVLGSFTLKSNFGLTLNVSNSDCAKATLYESRLDGCYDSQAPNWNQAEVVKLRRMGEKDYDQQALRQGLGWIRAHPAKFAGLTLERIREFWFPSRNPGTPPVLPLWIVTALSGVALAAMWRRRSTATFLFVAIAALYPLMYYVVVADMRYRYPIVWLSSLAVGYLGSLALEWVRLRRGWGTGLQRALKVISRPAR